MAFSRPFKMDVYSALLGVNFRMSMRLAKMRYGSPPVDQDMAKMRYGSPHVDQDMAKMRYGSPPVDQDMAMNTCDI